MPNSLMRSLRKIFRIKRTEREMDREVRFHLEMEAEENVRRGMAPEEARLAALRNFGGVERFKEEICSKSSTARRHRTGIRAARWPTKTR